MRVAPPEVKPSTRGACPGQSLCHVHNGDSVAEALGFLDVVGGHEDGFFSRSEVLDDVVNLAANLGIEPGGRSSRNTTFGSFTRANSKGKPLLLAAGKLL